MSEAHTHDSDGRRASLRAAGVGAVLGAGELVGGSIDGSRALLADMLHNFSDAFGYTLNAKKQEDSVRARRIRTWAGRIVCTGALVAIAEAAVHIDDESQSSLATVVLAGAAWGGSLYAHRQLHMHAGEGNGHGDNERHARWDKYCAPATLATTVLSYGGVAQADQVGTLIIGSVVIAANYPTQKRLGDQ